MVRTRAAAKRDLHPPSDDGTLERANAMASARSPPLAKRYRLRNLPGRKPGSRSSRGALDHEVDGLQVSLTSGDMSAPLASSTQGIDVSPDDSGLSDIPGTVATSRSVESAEPTPLLITRGPRAPPTRGAQGRGVSPDDTNLPVSPGVLSARRLPDSGVLADLRERCRELFDLPQEMATIEDFRIKSRTQWIQDIRRNQAREEIGIYEKPIEPYPGPKVSDFLGVSKAFFHASASAYIRNQSWDLAVVLESVKPIYNTTLMARPSFLPQHITALVVKVPTDDLIVYEDCIDPFPALRSIEYRPNTHITHRCDSKHAVKHIFEQEDFETIRAFRMWKKVRGLKGFSITAEAPPKWQDGVVTGVWEANVKKMEMLLNPLVTQPKPKTVQISSSCCGFSDATALQYQKCTNMSPSEHIRSAILKMKAGSTKEGDYFEEDVLQRPDAVVIDAFTKDPEGFISWARKMKSTKDNIEASKSVAK